MLTDVDSYLTFAQITNSTAAQRASIGSVVAAVSAALIESCKPALLEPTTITQWRMAAPASYTLILPFTPAKISTVQIWLNLDANGVVANFDTTADLLTIGTDYVFLPTGRDPTGAYSYSGEVTSRFGFWGGERWRPADDLASELVPTPGAVMVSYTAGPAVVTQNVRMACNLAVRLILSRLRTGAPVTSESWDGYSASYAAPWMVTAAINSPDVRAELDRSRPWIFA